MENQRVVLLAQRVKQLSPGSLSNGAGVTVSEVVLPPPPAPDNDPESDRHGWEKWIESYSNGEIALDAVMPAGPLVARPPPQGCTALHPTSIDPFGKVGATLTSSVSTKKTFEEKGYLPAVLGPWEPERRKVLRRYNLHQMGPGSKSLDRIADMAASVFSVPIVVISIVLENKEIFGSTLGWDERERETGFERIEIPLETALCPHAMTRPEDDSCFVLEDAASDWRFRLNPYVNDGGPIAFFASANIHLSSCSSGVGPTPPPRLPVGSICVVDKNPHAPGSWTKQNAFILKGLSEMIAREIELMYENDRAVVHNAQAAFLGEYLRTLLVNPSRPPSEADDDSEDKLALAVATAAETLVLLTNASACAIFDLRAFRTRKEPDQPSTSPNGERVAMRRPSLNRRITSDSSDYLSGDQSSLRLDGGHGEISLLASHGSAHDWKAATRMREAGSIISDVLTKSDTTNGFTFEAITASTPLAGFLPDECKSCCMMPVFDHLRTAGLLLVLCSFDPYVTAEIGDIKFAQDIGSITIAGLLRHRILEADRAKLAFISCISHELRSPLHGIRSNLELIKTVSSPHTLRTIEPLLDVAEICATSLKEVLDDTLSVVRVQFAKLSNARTQRPATAPKMTEVALEDVVIDAAKSCWARTTQQEIAFGGGSSFGGGDVELIVDYRLPPENRYLVDVGGLKRVLFNLIGKAIPSRNSSKFTRHGHITIVVKGGPEDMQERVDNVESVEIAIIDTGRGMAKEFLRGKLFTPFCQEDSFAPGAGLGISICSSVIERMHGDLHFVSEEGVGTTATICLPLKEVSGSRGLERRVSPDRTIRVVSEELRSLQNLAISSLSLDRPDEDRDALPTPSSSPVLPALEEKDTESLLHLRCLVADDNKIARRILLTFLKKKGIAHAEAENGEVAVALFREFRPNVVWCDIQMPVMDGITATKRMRKIEADEGRARARIVALSGLSSELSNHSDCLASGQIDQWIIKGGPSLAVLTDGLRKQEELLAARQRRADRCEEQGRRIRGGHEES